jgi:hypothetical protein
MLLGLHKSKEKNPMIFSPIGGIGFSNRPGGLLILILYLVFTPRVRHYYVEAPPPPPPKVHRK